MKLSNRKILITGGTSGIGLELTKQLVAQGNKLIICGRSKERLDEVKAQYPQQVDVFQCDLAEEGECEALVQWVSDNHSQTSVLINNAAIVHKEEFLGNSNSMAKAKKEMAVNFFAPLYLIKHLHPILIANLTPVIVNITTGLVYAPKAAYSFYNSTKSALHSFTQVYRLQTSSADLTVIEVLFPAVDTPWHKGKAPEIAISPREAVKIMLHGIAKGKKEIRVGKVRLLYLISRIAPNLAFKKINSI